MTSILGELEIIEKNFAERLSGAASSDELQQVKVAFLGKKGSLTSFLKKLGSLPTEERPAAGEAINSLRDAMEQRLASKKTQIEEAESAVMVPVTGPDP